MIATVYLFANGMVLTFDEKGEQMPGYQGRLMDVRAKILADAPESTIFHFADWITKTDVVVPRPMWARIRYDHDTPWEGTGDRRDHEHILIATVGLPRSGKTTWAQQQSYPVVNPDSIRLALHGNRFVMRAEPFVWAIAKAMVRALFLAGHKTVILDATNTTRARRTEWVSPDWGLYFKLFDTPAEECLARAAATNDDEIAPVIERMAGQFEPLAEDERPWI